MEHHHHIRCLFFFFITPTYEALLFRSVTGCFLPAFVPQDQPCRYNSSGMAVQCKGFKEIPVGSEQKLAQALSKVGPVSVGIDAGLGTFQFYQRGQ